MEGQLEGKTAGEWVGQIAAGVGEHSEHSVTCILAVDSWAA